MSFMRLIEQMGAADGCLLHVSRSPARDAQPVAWPEWLHPAVTQAYAAQGVAQPWSHQVEAATSAHDRRHTVLATGTGSGKSVGLWMAALDAAVRGREAQNDGRISHIGSAATTLYVAPTKALTADQATHLEALSGYIAHAAPEGHTPRGDHGEAPSGTPADARSASAHGAASGIQPRIGACDGDTPLEHRQWIRNHADIVLSNPDFVHFSLLPAHDHWARFLRSLRYILIDECHSYRGVFGAHVSVLLRRLLRVARHYGAEPTVVCASATVANPVQSVARLVGVPPEQVTCVDRSGAPTGERILALWQPAEFQPWDEEEAQRRSAVTDAARLATELTIRGARSLTFVRSRYAAEIVAEQTRRLVEQRQPALASSVAAYRGGYLADERRTLERDLRSGALRALSSTTALELGIDISGLDVVLMAGWPGTRASLLQQAGRAGRAGQPGVAVLIASDNPLDAYLVHHPELIADSPEAHVFDPTNPYILLPHLCAAAAELPLTPADLPLFGEHAKELVDHLVSCRLLRKRPQGWMWDVHRPERPWDMVSLRGDGPAQISIVESESGAVIGTVDSGSADSTVHPEAIYVHQGRVYHVDELSDDTAIVSRSPHTAVRTRARSHTSVTLRHTQESVPWPHGARMSYGSVIVTTQVTGYLRVRLPSREVMSTHDLDMPTHDLQTMAVWWEIPASTCADLGVSAADIPGALHAAEHAMIGMLPLLATCDRWDIGGLSTAVHPDTGAPTIIIYDGYQGGAGLSQRGYQAAAEWITATADHLSQCACSSGCPRCVQSPKCGNNNEPLDKGGALALLRFLRSCASSSMGGVPPTEDSQ